MTNPLGMDLYISQSWDFWKLTDYKSTRVYDFLAANGELAECKHLGSPSLSKHVEETTAAMRFVKGTILNPCLVCPFWTENMVV